MYAINSILQREYIMRWISWLGSISWDECERCEWNKYYDIFFNFSVL